MGQSPFTHWRTVSVSSPRSSGHSIATWYRPDFQDALIAPVGTLYDQSRSTASKVGSKVGLTKSDMLNGRLKLTVGFDTLFDKGKQDLYLTNRTYVPQSEYRNLSLFLQGEYKLLDTLTMHAGVRKEKADLEIDTRQILSIPETNARHVIRDAFACALQLRVARRHEIRGRWNAAEVQQLRVGGLQRYDPVRELDNALHRRRIVLG